MPVQPARVIAIGRTRRSISETLYVARLGRSVAYESRLESDLIMLMAADPLIEDFWAQPELFRLQRLGSRCSYVPDFLVWSRTDAAYREVKPSRVLARDPSLRGRRVEIEAAAALRGAAFEVWTEREIWREPYMSNARAIHFAPGPWIDGRAVARLKDVLAATGSAAAGDLLARAGLGSERLDHVLALVAVGEVRFADHHAAITIDSHVRSVTD